MIKPSDLQTKIKARLQATGVASVSYVESDLETPNLAVVLNDQSDFRIEVWVEEGEPPVLRIEAMLLKGLAGRDEIDLEFVLRTLNEMNRLEGTPWKLWLRGMRVEFEGVLGDSPLGEIWASWCIPSQLVAADYLLDLCRRFAERLERIEIPGLRESLAPLLAE